MFPAENARWPSAPLAVFSSSLSSLYSTTQALPFPSFSFSVFTHITPTFSSGFVFSTHLFPTSTPSVSQNPQKRGSATFPRTLSTENTWRPVTPFFSRASISPLSKSPWKIPPFPFGALASFPFSSKKSPPSMVKAGIVGCWKMCTCDLERPKNLLSLKYFSVSVWFRSEVMTQKGMGTHFFFPPSVAKVCRRKILSQKIWKRLF
mmetsp:Transcript_7773/g.15133  ORF Transcript_7773/g.15133 Transcript_7773/m.15133 type:complete len:205 (+) Transcript_7773:895-1509(+)